MSYPFDKNNLVTINYTNPEYDTIEIVFNDPTEDGKPNLVSFYGETADSSFHNYLESMGFDHETILEATKDVYSGKHLEFARFINSIIQEKLDDWKEIIAADYKQRYEEYRALIEKELQQKIENLESQEMTALRDYKPDPEYMDYLKKKNDYKNIADSTIINVLIDSNKDEETIFKAKLAIFQLSKVKDNKDKSIKSKIRKSTSLAELIEILRDIKIL